MNIEKMKTPTSQVHPLGWKTATKTKFREQFEEEMNGEEKKQRRGNREGKKPTRWKCSRRHPNSPADGRSHDEALHIKHFLYRLDIDSENIELIKC